MTSPASRHDDARSALLRAVDPDSIPEMLKVGRRHVGWRYEDRKDQPKPAKMPYSPNAPKGASSTAPADWVTFDEAVRYAQGAGLDGIMRAFEPSDGMVGIDFDNCLDPETGELTPEAAERVRRADTYTEVSPSGTGVKMWVYGSLPPYGRKRGDVEMYCAERFFTMTGQRLKGTPATVGYRPDFVLALHREVWGEAPDLTTAADDPERTIPALEIGDEDVLRLATESPHNGERFRRLWAGDTSDYARDDNDGVSEADAALCELLAHYGGPDRERIERLWLRSGLGNREKVERADYRKRTIDTALRGKTRFYGDNAQPAVPIGSDGASGCSCENCPHRTEENHLRRKFLDVDDEREADRHTLQIQRERLKNALGFITNISAIIAKPNEELSAGEKVVSLGLMIEMHFRAAAGPYKLSDGTEGSYRTKSGAVRMPRSVIARRTGYSENRASDLARSVAQRDGAPYKWSTPREWGTRQDGTEGWITTIEVQPLTTSTTESLRAIVKLPALPEKPKHGGSPQATEAREQARRGRQHPDADVIVNGTCAVSGEDLGDTQVTAQEWEALKHQLGVSEGQHPTVAVSVPKGHQVDVSDDARAAAMVAIQLGRDSADPWKQPTPKPANLGPIRMTDRRASVVDGPDPDGPHTVYVDVGAGDDPPPLDQCVYGDGPLAPGHRVLCSYHRDLLSALPAASETTAIKPVRTFRFGPAVDPTKPPKDIDTTGTCPSCGEHTVRRTQNGVTTCAVCADVLHRWEPPLGAVAGGEE
jgi:primase-polymerase (primpol)-like protein